MVRVGWWWVGVLVPLLPFFSQTGWGATGLCPSRAAGSALWQNAGRWAGGGAVLSHGGPARPNSEPRSAAGGAGRHGSAEIEGASCREHGGGVAGPCVTPAWGGQCSGMSRAPSYFTAALRGFLLEF